VIASRQSCSLVVGVKPLEVVDAIDIAQLITFKAYSVPASRGSVTLLSQDEPEKLIELLHTEAQVI
jgi:electron transfer flavoprotein beta subunit